MTPLLREAMIFKISYEEGQDHLPKDYEVAGWLWDKNNPKLNKEYWDKFGYPLMKWWRKYPKNAGKRPWLFFKCYPEKPKILGYKLLKKIESELVEKYPQSDDDRKYPIYETQEDFLRRVGLLENWEGGVIAKQKREGTYKKKEFETINYFD